MDKASDFGSEDCRFESSRGRLSFCKNETQYLHSKRASITVVDAVDPNADRPHKNLSNEELDEALEDD